MGSFRTRMLVVVVLVIMIGLSLQTDHASSRYITPILSQYVLSDNDWPDKIASWWSLDDDVQPGIAVWGEAKLKLPCEYIGIAQGYGWSWNSELQKQVFNSGVVLQVEPNTFITPVLPGKVLEIIQDGAKQSVLLEHSGNMFSYYGELEEVWVKLNQEIEQQPLGKTSGYFEFQLRDQDGPVNPSKLFE